MADRSIKKLSQAELETELLQMRQRVALFDASEAFARVGHFEWNLCTRRFQSCSAAFAGIVGVSREELLDTESGLDIVVERIHPSDREAYRDLLLNAIDGGCLDIKFRLIDRAGGTRTLFQAGIDLPKFAGRAGIMSVVVQDISAQTSPDDISNREESLALQAERISELGNFIYDEVEDRYLYSSPGCSKIYGMSEEDYLQETGSYEEDLSDILEEDREHVKRIYDDYYSSGRDCEIEFRIRRGDDGEVRWIRELLVALQMKHGKVTLTQGVMQDITAQKNIEMQLRESKQDLEGQVAARTEELAETITRLQDEIHEREKISAELEFLANHDPLTGLPSLRLCKDRLESALAGARRSQHMVAVMFLDLDGFKAVNDSYGHEFGDTLLKKTASRISAEVRETDTVARIGGDEFLVILSGIPDLSIVERIASNLIELVSQPVTIGHIEIAIGTSIGVALYPDDATDSDELIRVADQTMYTVKHSGKNHFGFARSSRLN